MSDALRSSIRGFCEAEIELKQCTAAYRERCEPSTVARNTSYASLVRVMQDDSVNVMELPSGGYLRRSVIKTQCSLKSDVVSSAVKAAVTEFREFVRSSTSSGSDLNMTSARETLRKLIKKHVRDQRTTELTKVTHVTTLPRGVSDYDIPRANDFVNTTTQAWMNAQKDLSAAREAHKTKLEQLGADRTKHLDVSGVREYIKQECPNGKPVRIQGHDDSFTLRYSESKRRLPIREGHVQDAIAHAVSTLLVDTSTPVSASDLSALIMDTAVERAGTQKCDTFLLAARTGRKRAVDGSEK